MITFITVRRIKTSKVDPIPSIRLMGNRNAQKLVLISIPLHRIGGA